MGGDPSIRLTCHPASWQAARRPGDRRSWSLCRIAMTPGSSPSLPRPRIRAMAVGKSMSIAITSADVIPRSTSRGTCSGVRGIPSMTDRLWSARGRASSSLVASGVKSPVFRSKASFTPVARSRRISSPTEKWRMPIVSASCRPWVVFPLPGGPTIRILRIPSSCKRAEPWLRPISSRFYGCCAQPYRRSRPLWVPWLPCWRAPLLAAFLAL